MYTLVGPNPSHSGENMIHNTVHLSIVTCRVLTHQYQRLFEDTEAIANIQNLSASVSYKDLLANHHAGDYMSS